MAATRVWLADAIAAPFLAADHERVGTSTSMPYHFLASSTHVGITDLGQRIKHLPPVWAMTSHATRVLPVAMPIWSKEAGRANANAMAACWWGQSSTPIAKPLAHARDERIDSLGQVRHDSLA